MLFCSREYLLFFLAVFVLYWIIPWHRSRVSLLLAASFAFYASWNRWLAVLICASTLMDYLIARGLERYHGRGTRRFLLGASLAANLGMLGYFKYANFFLGSIQQTLNAMGTSASFPVLQVILPIGISFYTFEAINYTVDVYRRHIPAERSLPHFMLFILFFPHLIAGPIVRARDFLPQVRRRKRWSWPRLNLGGQLFLLGLFKKIAIADRMALLADPVFANPCDFRTSALWMAALAWAIQVYCDFSGYTDMALGSRTCSVTSSRPTSTCLTWPPTSPSSGDAGTFRFRAGCAIICSFPWEAVGATAGKPPAICSSPWLWAACGTAPAGPSWSSASFTVCCWLGTANSEGCVELGRAGTPGCEHRLARPPASH